jgi:thiol-disulfide isomerase/thioredoxin
VIIIFKSFLKTVLTLLIVLIFSLEISLALGDPWKEMGIIKRTERSFAYDFTLPTPDGDMIRLSSLRGKVVLLNFWATWCGPCKEEMPSIERLYKKLKDKGLKVLAVDVMESNELTFPTVIDEDRKTTDQYRVIAIPTTHLIDKAGRIVGTAFGAREWDNDAVFEIVDQLLRE